MKKIISLMLCAILSVGLIGCSSSTDLDSDIKEEQVSTDTTEEKEDNIENNEKTDKEEYDSNIYEATVVCPECGKNAGATEDGKIICKYCKYEGKHKTQAEKQKKYENKTYDDGYNDGYGVGYDIGVSDGYNQVSERTTDREAYLNEKYDDGYSDGYQQGYKDGYNIGMNRYEKEKNDTDYEPGSIKEHGGDLGEKEWNEDEPEEHDDSYYE